MRKKLENVYLFEGLEEGKIPESAKSPTYSPREVAEMFDKAKKNMRSASVNEAVMIINGALESDINDYLTVVKNYNLYEGGFIKWKADVSGISKTNIDGVPKNKARLLIYDNNVKEIVGVADLIYSQNISLETKSHIEVYAKILGYDNLSRAVLLDTQIIKHLPNKK